MSVNLLQASTIHEGFDQLGFRNRLAFRYTAGDGGLELTDDGAPTPVAKVLIHTRSGHAMTFARASTGSYIGKNGRVATSPANMPRFHWIDSDGDGVLDLMGLLIEPARANTITFTESVDNAAFTKNATTVTANAGTAPDGKATMDRIVETSASAEHNVLQATGSFTANTRQSFSVFVKASGRSHGRFYIVNGSDIVGARFDLTTGTVATNTSGAGALTHSRIVKLADDVYRLEVTGIVNASSTSANLILQLDTAGFSGSYAGNSALGLFAWGFQFEADAPFSTSYVARTGAGAASRSQDNLRVEWPYLARPMSVYLRATEIGLRYTTAAASAAWALGLGTGSTTDPRLFSGVATGGAGYFVTWDPATAATATLAAFGALGETFEHVVNLDSAGVATIRQSIEEAAETSAAATAQAHPIPAQYFGNSQSGARLMFGDIGALGSNPGVLLIHELKADWSQWTSIDQARAAA